MSSAGARVIESDVLGRLPWSRLRWVIVLALAVTWVPDGLEAQLVGNAGAG